MTFSTRRTAAVLCGVVATASLPATASAHSTRGELLDVVPVSTMDANQVAKYLGDHSLDASRVRFAVDAKRIVYRTIDPYVDAPSTVTASVDALRATRQFASRRGLHPDHRVMITGHSQGGHATMALGQALHRGADPRLTVGALAPIGGPFKPSLLVSKALDDKISNGVAYMAYWTVAWNRLHHLYATPAEAFNDPSVEALFDGEHRNEDIFPHLPPTMRELLTSTYFARVQTPTGVLRAKLREADSYCDWRPQVPVTIYSSAGDKDTLLETSAYCDQRLKQHHARSTLIDLGADVNHGQAAKLALPRILADFDRR